MTRRQSEPVLKWTGSKRSQAVRIIESFPASAGTYYEPFCGGCSVWRALVSSGADIEKYVLSDVNADLIGALLAVKDHPDDVSGAYAERWEILKELDGIDRKRHYYNSVRERFNTGHDVMDFIFLDRTCFNGLIRYNSSGDFNAPFHFGRDGIHPDKFRRVVSDWSEAMNSVSLTLLCKDYRDVLVSCGSEDFVYLDPPYEGNSPVYSGTFDREAFFSELRRLGMSCQYAVSYNGVEPGSTEGVLPADTYARCLCLVSGSSSFGRLKGVQRTVYESLYLNF